MSWARYFALKMGEEGEERTPLVHAIVPTTLVVKLRDVESGTDELGPFLKHERDACCKCRASVLGIVSYVCLYVLMAPKRAGLTVTWAALCGGCVPEPQQQDGYRLFISGREMVTLIDCATEVLKAGYSCAELLDFTDALNAQSGVIFRRMSKSKFQRCYACLKTDVPLRRCSGCNYARYCSPECSRARWPTHKPECQYLAGAQLLFDPSFRLMIKK